MSALSALLVGIAIVMILIWYRSRGTEHQLEALSSQLSGLARRRKRSMEKTQQYLSRIFNIFQQSMTANNMAACCKAADLLKTAYGDSITRPNEIKHLVGLTVVAIRDKKPDAAVVLIDAIRPLIRNQGQGELTETLEQLQLLAVVALREKQNFLAAKIIDFVFHIMDRPEGKLSQEIPVTALGALRSIGALVVRRRDISLLREISARLVSWYQQTGKNYDHEIAVLIAAWLHRILHSSNQEAFEVTVELLRKLTDVNPLQDEVYGLLLKELKDLAGTACLDPNSGITALLIAVIIDSGSRHETISHFKQSIKAVGEVVRLAIHSHGLSRAFPNLIPVMDYGRKLLIMELKFGGIASNGSFRQQALFLCVKECLSILEFTVRQRMADSAGDIISEIIKYWEASADTLPKLKSFKKFCGLILLYLGATRRQKQSALDKQRLAHLAAFSDKERERLQFMVGGLRYELFSGIGSKI